MWNSFWATCYGVMAFLIIVGNSLTIATLLRKKFRQRPQFLLISLAFADLLVGCATTLYVIVLTMHRLFAYRLFPQWFVFNLLDISVGLSSIFHLAVISLERLHATLRPFRHRQLSLKAYWVAIATIWFLSSTMGILVSILIRFDLIMQRKMLIIIATCILTPLLITCFCYLAIWRNWRKSTMRSFRSTKPRSKILGDHFPCDSDIFHNVDAFSVFYHCHKGVTNSYTIGNSICCQAPSI